MSDKKTFFLINDQVKAFACEQIRSAPETYVCELKPKTRTLEQNSKLWAMLGEVSQQVIWYGQKLTSEEWKDVFTASLKQQKVVPGIDGGFVVCGQRTSKMTKSELSDLIELMYAFGVQHNVRFKEVYDEV